MPKSNPSYPSVALPIALEKASLLFDEFDKSEIDLSKAFDCWGYKPRSRTGNKLVDALESYGLINSIETDQLRRIKIGRAAMRDYFSGRATEKHRDKAVREFALNPAIYHVIWEKWGNRLPKGGEVERFLVDDLGYSQKVMKSLLGDYLTTVEFAHKHGLEVISHGKADTDLDLDDEDDSDEVGLVYTTQSRYSRIPEDTDTDLEADNDVLDLDLIPDITSLDFEIEKGAVDTEVIEIGVAGIEGLVVAKSSKEKTSSAEFSHLREFGQYPVSSDCKFYLYSDGPVDRAAFEALVAQLLLRLEFGEFEDDDDD